MEAADGCSSCESESVGCKRFLLPPGGPGAFAHGRWRRAEVKAKQGEVQGAAVRRSQTPETVGKSRLAPSPVIQISTSLTLALWNFNFRCLFSDLKIFSAVCV